MMRIPHWWATLRKWRLLSRKLLSWGPKTMPCFPSFFAFSMSEAFFTMRALSFFFSAQS
jgi:hypothetical protein